jgi:hypothetical protein
MRISNLSSVPEGTETGLDVDAAPADVGGVMLDEFVDGRALVANRHAEHLCSRVLPSVLSHDRGSPTRGVEPPRLALPAAPLTKACSRGKLRARVDDEASYFRRKARDKFILREFLANDRGEPFS